MTKQPIAVRGAWEPVAGAVARLCFCLLLEKADQQAATIRSALDPEETFAQMLSCERPSLTTFVLAAYSITSSARSKVNGGTARPSALAVLRFRTISYFVGNCDRPASRRRVGCDRRKRRHDERYLSS